jgi:hypothetical protein
MRPTRDENFAMPLLLIVSVFIATCGPQRLTFFKTLLNLIFLFYSKEVNKTFKGLLAIYDQPESDALAYGFFRFLELHVLDFVI